VFLSSFFVYNVNYILDVCLLLAFLLVWTVFVVCITIGQFVLLLVVFVAWSLTKLCMFCYWSSVFLPICSCWTHTSLLFLILQDPHENTQNYIAVLLSQSLVPKPLYNKSELNVGWTKWLLAVLLNHKRIINNRLYEYV
jgi:hypothetical protein